MGKIKILIVEDDADVIEFVRLSLGLEFEIVTAENGREAVEVFERETPNLVITDVYMPQKDGLDLIKELRAISQIPILVQSGGNIGNLKNYFEYHKVDSILEKPFTQAELRQAIQTALATLR